MIERTDAEIIARMEAVKANDFFGTISGDLMEYLGYEAAKPFLKEGVTLEQFTEAGLGKPRDRDSIVGQIKQYMGFAWDKANNCRGLSAGRSLNHMQAWLWMLGEDAAADALDHYTLYGKPQLRAICERYGIDWRALDDGHWRNDEDGDGQPAPSDGLVLPFLGA